MVNNCRVATQADGVGAGEQATDCTPTLDKKPM